MALTACPRCHRRRPAYSRRCPTCRFDYEHESPPRHASEPVAAAQPESPVRTRRAAWTREATTRGTRQVDVEDGEARHPDAGVAGAASGFQPTLLIPFILAAAVLSERVHLSLSTGGSGALPLLVVAAPAVAVATIARYTQRRSLPFVTNPAFLIGVLPFLGLTVLLPILGVLLNGYPERTLLAATDATTAFSFLVIGAALARVDRSAWSRWLVAAILLQLVYAAGQALYVANAPGAALFAPFHAWDLSFADINTFVQARSSGFYLNPNELGYWAAAAVILSWLFLQGRTRVLGVALSVMTLVLSQSRGATVALLCALALGVLLAMSRKQLNTSRVLKGAGALILVSGVAVVLTLALAPQSDILARFGALGQVATQGAGADANLAGRFDYWQAVLELNRRYPWGTLGPVQILLGTAVDSAWFTMFAQGSVLYVTTLALVVLTSLLLPASRHGDALRLSAVVVAVASISQDPFGYPAIVVFWALLGASLASSLTAEVRRPAVEGIGWHQRGTIDA